MILGRVIQKAKPGCFGEAVAMGRAECETMGIPYRVYSPIAGLSNLVVFEFQFEDMAAYEAFWPQWRAKPETQAFWAKYYHVVENEQRAEQYRLLATQGTWEGCTILEQVTHKVKWGCFDQAVALGQEEADKDQVPYRAYTPLTGPHNVVVFEWPFKDMKARDDLWTKAFAKPNAQAFLDAFYALVENESQTQFCRVL